MCQFELPASRPPKHGAAARRFYTLYYVSASPWIWAIARHKLIDILRRRGRRIYLPVEDFSEMLASEEEEPDRLIAGVDRHLETLSPGQRSVLQAIAIDGASIGEAAERLS